MNKAMIAICTVALLCVSLASFAQDSVTNGGSPSDVTSTSSQSPFSGTTWESSTKPVSTITFKTDGNWSEEYAPHPLRGHWYVTKDKTVVTVRLFDGAIKKNTVIHFVISDDGATCSRVEAPLTWTKKTSQ